MSNLQALKLYCLNIIIRLTESERWEFEHLQPWHSWYSTSLE